MAGDFYEGLRRGTLTNLVYRIGRKDYIAPDELAEILLRHRGQVLPVPVLDYVAAVLRGEIKQRRGRKKATALEVLRQQMACIIYDRYLEWLQTRQKRGGLEGWTCIRRASWWQGAPNERAATMTAHWFRRARWNISARYIQNLVSSHNRR